MAREATQHCNTEEGSWPIFLVHHTGPSPITTGQEGQQGFMAPERLKHLLAETSICTTWVSSYWEARQAVRTSLED